MNIIMRISHDDVNVFVVSLGKHHSRTMNLLIDLVSDYNIT